MYEFATIEWLWDEHAIRINLPGGDERRLNGNYNELVAVLCDLGRYGWDVASSTSGGNWVFWTMRRHH
ncbi:hypothetical protein [Actinomadura roseirufa]|uniref:hypothetical protein n=1 Tax=Actinomadura roseirufa TaxID=2094049 RepID=UPI001F5E81DB|nr:hypothetical protein [Actinomadura roseirufa]